MSSHVNCILRCAASLLGILSKILEDPSYEPVVVADPFGPNLDRVRTHPSVRHNWLAGQDSPPGPSFLICGPKRPTLRRPREPWAPCGPIWGETQELLPCDCRRRDRLPRRKLARCGSSRYLVSGV